MTEISIFSEQSSNMEQSFAYAQKDISGVLVLKKRHCSTILTNCMEPKAMIEMQNELWNILQAMMTKKEPFENFKCEQHPTNSLTSVMTPAKLIINLGSVMVLLVLFYY